MSSYLVPRPRAFVGLETDHGFMIVNRNDCHTLPSGVSYGVGFQLFSSGSYESGEISLVLDILRNRRRIYGDGIVALDVGANIGVHALEMGREVFGWGSVLAFEAQERLFYALCGNLALNNLSNVRAFNVAIGDATGAIRIPQPNYNRPASFGSLELQTSPERDREYIGQSVSYMPKDLVSVPCETLDNLRLSRVDFIKIDVEGMELAVLHGAENILSSFTPELLIEWIKSDKDALISYLSDFGYNSFSEVNGNLHIIKVNEEKFDAYI